MKSLFQPSLITKASLLALATLALSACDNESLEKGMQDTKFEKWSVKKLLNQCDRKTDVCFAVIQKEEFINRATSVQKVALCKAYPKQAGHLCQPLFVTPPTRTETKVEEKVLFAEKFGKALRIEDDYDRFIALDGLTAETLNDKVLLAASQTVNGLIVNEPVDAFATNLFALNDVKHLSESVQAIVYWQAKLRDQAHKVVVRNRVKTAVDSACDNSIPLEIAIYQDSQKEKFNVRAKSTCFAYFKEFVSKKGVVNKRTVDTWARAGLDSVTDALMDPYAEIPYELSEERFTYSDSTTGSVFSIFAQMLESHKVSIKDITSIPTNDITAS